MAAVSAVAVTGMAALLSGDARLAACSAGFIIVGSLRVNSVRKHLRDRRRLQIRYAWGAYASAALSGLAAIIAILSDVGEPARILVLINAMSHAFGVCALNASRPRVAIGQLALIVLPVIVACLVDGSSGMLAVAVTVILMVPAMSSITLFTFRILRDSVSAADRSAAMARKMEQLARSDSVTGLANRAGLDHELDERLIALAPGAQLAMFWLDLDRFKEVNDLLGHPVGDRVLAEVARRLRSVCPEDAAIARFGGDEFVVVGEISDRKGCEALLAAIRDEIGRPACIDGEQLDIPVSIGVALLPGDASDRETLMQNADLALYHAKASGRNRTCFYDPTMSRDFVRRREIESELREALQRDELSIYFQPLVDLASGRIRSFEALVRWFHPLKGELQPDEFIPVAEATGMIVELGNWITAQAAQACARWPRNVGVSVNLSPLQAKAPGAALGILTALRSAGLAPERLELEVTETLFLEDDVATTAFIQELSAAGVRFALDDFGTGYSSLGSIQKFTFSTIKVDRSFISGAAAGPKSDAIIRAVTEMGSRLNMQIVAEGLETPEQMAAVRRAGCSLGQGYYFSRAVPEHAAALMLAHECDEFERRRLAG